MDDQATAFLNYGNIDQWNGKNKSPMTGIGFTLKHGSWPVYDGTKADGFRTFWRNPDTSQGDLWGQPGRFGTISQWFPKQTGMWWIDIWANLGALRQAVVIPWDSSWTEVGGTQAESPDNGIIIEVANGYRYEIQGMARLGPLGAAHVNVRTFLSGLPNENHYRADGISFANDKTKSYGSQGPWAKTDGLMRASWLRGPWPGPARFVGFNVAWGPTATAVEGAWVEHQKAQQPSYGGMVPFPMGDDPKMLNCGRVFKVDISNAEIEMWIDATTDVWNIPLRSAKRWFAIGMRDHGMRLSETGSGSPIIESAGASNPIERAELNELGIITDRDASNIGADLFTYGRLYAA